MTQLPDGSSTKLEPYKTSDTPFAAFLHLSGKKVVGTKQDPNDYKREVLIFVNDEDIPELEKTWMMNKATGDLKAYHRSLKLVNRLVNEARKSR